MNDKQHVVANIRIIKVGISIMANPWIILAAKTRILNIKIAIFEIVTFVAGPSVALASYIYNY